MIVIYCRDRDPRNEDKIVEVTGGSQGKDG
jgi:hypothetical protein